MSIILQVDGLLGNITGTVYGGQVRSMGSNSEHYELAQAMRDVRRGR